MFIECYQNNGIPYLRLVRSVRRPMKKDPSKYTSYKVTELSIGPLSRFDDGKPDYVQRLKQSFKDGKPLIATLQKYVNQPTVPQTHGIEAGTDLFSSFAHPRYCATILLDTLFRELGLTELFHSIKHATKIQYPLADYARLLVFDRILNPASKMATVSDNTEFMKPIIIKDPYEYHVYDALDVIYKYRLQILRRLHSSITKHIHRDMSLLYYDVTNFYFEIGQPDDDEYDEEGQFLQKGLRKKGVSKENRKLPLVQMSLFLDNSGLPVSINLFPGNTLDHATAVPSYESTVQKLGVDQRFIFIADRGICQGPIICRLADTGNGYIMSKSIRKSGKTIKKWILDTDGYIPIGDDFRYKAQTVEISVKDTNGNVRKLKQKLVCYWSRRFYKREAAEHRFFLAFIEKLKTSPERFRVTKTQVQSIHRFIRKEIINTENGEVLDSRKLMSLIDEEKLEEYTGLMGYYMIATSELDMDPLEVIDKYHGLSRIENQFEEMKGPLDARPMHVRTPQHIYAHLLICMIALLMIRMIQRKYVQKNPPSKTDKRNWTYGLTGTRVQRALQRWKAIPVGEDVYWLADVDNPDLAAILQSFSITLPPKQYSYGELRRMKNNIDIF